MPSTPANHRDRVARIQALCTELTAKIKTSEEQRKHALKLAAEALALATAVEEDTDRAKSARTAKAAATRKAR